MIDRSNSELELVCDSTGERYPRTYEPDEFHKMLADAKEDGWVVMLRGGEWRHLCPKAMSDDFVEVPDID
jgi:hypothetical protein